MTASTLTTAPGWLSLFNSDGFHALNVGPGQVARSFTYEEDGRPVCTLSGVLEGDVFTSGFSAPFGGPDFARPRETPGRIVAALADVVDQAQRDGAATIRIRGRGASWTPNEPVVHFALLNLGFRMEVADLSYAVDLRRFATIDDYVAALRSPARRALGHAAREPFTFGETDAWEAPYIVLDRNRRARGRRLALSLAYLQRARAALPGRVRMFELRHDGTVCAAALVFVVQPERWYVQAWGDALHELRRSPMNALVARLVEQALNEGVEILDLGRTTEDGPGGTLRVGEGLAQFKQSILAQAELRPVLVR